MAFKGDKKNVGLILSGQQVLIPQTNLFITQPTINQIVVFGEDDFLAGVSLLTHHKKFIENLKMGNPELSMYPDFQIFMTVLKGDISVRQLIDKIFILIFPNYIIEIEEMTINFFTEEEGQKILIGQLHPYNFEFFQDLVHDLFSPHSDDETQREFNPANDAAAAIAKKLEKGRQQRAQIQGPQSLFGVYCSVLSIGLGMDIHIFYEYTPFQLYDAYNRFFEKQRSDFYMKVSTTPFMDVSKMETPKEWSRNLY